MIQSKGQRNKLLSGAKWRIQTGDIVELIPGQYLFKYVAANETMEGRMPTTTREKRPSGEESSKGKQPAQSRKRMHRVPEEDALAKISNVRPLFFWFTYLHLKLLSISGPGLQDMPQPSNQEANTSSEGIRSFQISKNKLPLTFRLLRVKELPDWANTNAVSISDVIQVSSTSFRAQ